MVFMLLIYKENELEALFYLNALVPSSKGPEVITKLFRKRKIDSLLKNTLQLRGEFRIFYKYNKLIYKTS